MYASPVIAMFDIKDEKLQLIMAYFIDGIVTKDCHQNNNNHYSHIMVVHKKIHVKIMTHMSRLNGCFM